MLCPACGFEADATFAFCPKCGQRLEVAAPEPESDRRPVTVMFADLSGFTSLSESLDPEVVRALQTELFAEMASSIQRLDGFVEKYVGDAVMAVFGAPVAHDEDPTRAVSAALLLHERIAALSERWQPSIGRPLALHIGINTGPVVAGRIGSNPAATYAVTGDTVNAAARLQSAAGAGETLVSRSTWLLTRHAFGFEEMPALSLKGKSQPVIAYRLGAALAAPLAARGLQAHGLATPLVGRDADLDALVCAFEAMRAGQCQLASLVAEAGTGKSRLVAEFVAQLRAFGRLEGVAVRNAACSSLGERTYGVPAALLRDAYGLSQREDAVEAQRKIAAALVELGVDPQEREQVASYLGCVLGLEGDDARTRYLDPEQLKRQIFSAVLAVIQHRLQREPVMLIVEDLHWADAASLDVLRYLLDQLGGKPFMLLVTHRPVPEVGVLAGGSTAHTRIALEPLSPACSATLLDGLFGTSRRTLPDELRMRIVEHAGGNPLFLEEMVRALIADGVLRQQDGAWICSPRATAEQVPLTIHGLLLGRIDRLPVPVRQTLREAAVIGPVFGEAMLRDVATARAGALSDALDALVGAGLLSLATPSTAAPASRDRQFRFRHGLFQEVAYETLLISRRTELHTRIGEGLERLCGGTPRHLEELQVLAHHFRLGADKSRAVHYLVAAGDWARKTYANADAIRHYEFALETLSQAGGGDEGQPLQIRERLADVLAPAGRIADATAHLDAVREGYARTGDRIAQARVLRKIAALRWEVGQRDEARQCLDAGLALMNEAAPHPELAWLFQKRGELAFRSGDSHGALAWTERALAHIRSLDGTTDALAGPRGSRAAVALALNIQGIALARLDRIDEAVERLEQSIEVARAADLPQVECRALSNLGVLYSSSDPQRAIDACERGLQTAHRIGDLGLQSRLSANLAVAYCTLTNRCDERGMVAAHDAIRIDRSTGQLDHLAVSLVVLAQIYQCHGDPLRALRYYREALALAEKSGEPQLLFPCYDGLATLHLDLDKGEEAEHYMELASDLCERAGLDPDALVVLPFLA
ncbi:adenylate/guanylate cyclase domain-containing protein [Variovorax sp. YR216]|uniref:adenylate/guanylate cyclase domain-containing protein n=1 Tax=Variovorax sp. YR216 TaxID=1882828 RepID=UPI0008971098|nr:adenylate/guanylate cyclase domain-containing protein [Variovorax sp. YR216]SEA15613.1 AAA ATPase domain-containing protein [Variovorax sp. YR216]